MQAKRKVLARFPDAKLAQQTEFHWSVKVGDKWLDYHDRNDWQGKTAAWRTAYSWCVRNPGDVVVLPLEHVPDGDGWRLETGNQFSNRWVRP